MMSEKRSEVNIDEKKLNQMKLGIILAERKNLKTREKSNDEMVETIRKIIENEIKKNY
ncbi:hypothetical protein ACE8FZ_00760 [Peribacillus frigoritolerans]|uniref:hypothetical protein n=2 Tax=Peribacillus frigoritolerans TaxID=450367 RepID=UPI0035CF31FC